MDYTQLFEVFQQQFGHTPRLFRSPGRINLIGEHTDYNEGFVLPAAIDKEMAFAIAPNGTSTCRLYSIDLAASFSFALNDFAPVKKRWPNYLMGVTDQLLKAGCQIQGYDCVFGGNIPIGAGMSSSAALECGLAFGLNATFQLGLHKLQMVKYAQMAEHNFAGVKCGIMDQFASMFGKEKSVIRLDCRSLDYQYVPFELADYQVVLCNSKVSHSLASSAYNVRRQQCEAGVSLLKSYYPTISSLRDVQQEQLLAQQAAFDPVVFKRCQYVVSENNRLLDACECLAEKRMQDFGELLYQTHKGLSQDYEVSCPELDFLVDFTLDKAGVIGSRMMGGGFGGCTINLVATDYVPEFEEEITIAYAKKFDRNPEIYTGNIVQGSSEIS